MEKQLRLNRLINVPYLELDFFNSLVKSVRGEKQLKCTYHEGEPEFHVAFMLLKLYVGFDINFINCDLNYPKLFNLININSIEIETFLINYLVNKINMHHQPKDEVYTLPFDHPRLKRFLNENYFVNKNLKFILIAITSLEDEQ